MISPRILYGDEYEDNRIEPTWLPDPYKHRQVIIDDPTFSVIYYYDDSGENFISFQVDYQPGQSTTTINTEDAEITQFDDGNRSIFISARTDERILVAMDHQSGYQILISGKGLSQEEIMKILESTEEIK